MKRIMIDMDDVICNTGKRFLYLVNEFQNTNYTENDIKDYYIQTLIPKENRKEWAEFYKEQNVYDGIELVPNALEVMKKLSKEYELYILTSYIFKDNPYYSANCLKQKYEWLMNNIDFIPPQHYIFTSSKEIIDCDIRIDDREKNLVGKSEKKFLFTAYHNKNISDKELETKGIIRVNGWKDIEKELL